MTTPEEQAGKAIVHVGRSASTSDMVWCECEQGLSLQFRWDFCPRCGRSIDQESYRNACAAVLDKGISWHRNNWHDGTEREIAEDVGRYSKYSKRNQATTLELQAAIERAERLKNCCGGMCNTAKASRALLSLGSQLEAAAMEHDALVERSVLAMSYAEDDLKLWEHIEPTCPMLVAVHKLRLRSNAMEKLLNTPEIEDYAKAVVAEAQHQRHRWGSEHDEGKEPADWYWLVGYLGGKCLAAALAGDVNKALNHAISTSAVLANWHAAILGQTDMRPGIETPKGFK